MTQDRAAAMPPVLGRLMRGTFFLALKTPLQAVIALVSVPLIQRYIGPTLNGAYAFAWGFGFFQFLLEFGMSSALQREVADTWTRGDRAGVNRAISCGMDFYAAMALIQAAALLGVAYVVLPASPRGRGGRADRQAPLAPGADVAVLRALGGRLERAPGGAAVRPLPPARIAGRGPPVRAAGARVRGGARLLRDRRGADGPADRPAAGPGLWVMVRELGYTPTSGGSAGATWRPCSG